MSSSNSPTSNPSAGTRIDSVTYDLPGEDVFPEGIALFEEEDAFFVSGARSGAIYRGDLRSGELKLFVAGDGRAPLTTVGLTVDSYGQLWVAGGASGKIFVFGVGSGELQMTLSTPAADDTFINDLAAGTSGDIYVTDSLRPVLFRVRSGSGEVESWLDLTGTAFESREPGSDTNGIVITPDEAYLIVVKTGTGQLFRVETRRGEVHEIDLAGVALTGGDGLVLDGRTLYVVRNSERSVAIVELDADFLSGRVMTHLSDPTLEFPTTAAKVGDDLLVVNSQFDVMNGGEPRLPFRVTRLRVR